VPEQMVATIVRATGRAPAPGGGLPAAPPASAPAAPAASFANAGAAPGAPLLLDTEVLAATFGHEPGRMRRFAFMFLDSAREGLAEIDSALASGDLARAGAVAHRLKSSARAVGAMAFAEACHELEHQHMRSETRGEMHGAIANGRALGARLRSIFAHLERQVRAELGAPATDGS
jgi:two-component system sensor histidine kinase/response regulator